MVNDQMASQLFPWREGTSLAWDVTVIDTFAASYLTASADHAGGAAEIAVKRKTIKYSSLSTNYEYCPIAFETMGPINEEGSDFISAIGKRISAITGEKREPMFLFQRLSIAIQRGNAAAIREAHIELTVV